MQAYERLLWQNIENWGKNLKKLHSIALLRTS